MHTVHHNPASLAARSINTYVCQSDILRVATLQSLSNSLTYPWLLQTFQVNIIFMKYRPSQQ